MKTNSAWALTIDGVRFIHITDDGPDVAPESRVWCEYLDGRGTRQACMSTDWVSLVAAVKAELAR